VTDKLFNESIMLVDDEPENLNVLTGMLQEGPWRVYAFPRGDLALQAAKANPPDLVLMDIRMPGMSGYEACRLFKQDERLKDIPVVFLSALSDPQDKIEAFQIGGADYVTKPFNSEEVLARVRGQLEVYRYRRQLEGLVRQRTAALQDAHRRLEIWDSAKTNWLNAISHEMRTPLSGIIGITELLIDEINPGPEMRDLLGHYDSAVKRIDKLMTDAVLLSQIDVASESFDIDVVDPGMLLADAVLGWQKEFPAIRVNLQNEVPFAGICAEPKLVRQAFGDLLFAVQCCVLDGEEIDICVDQDGNDLRCTMSTNGQSLPQEALDAFFEVGGQRVTLKGGADFGLSPVLASHIIELFHGSVSVRNGELAGIVIDLTLPLAETSRTL
jgi:two-component system sensor histidine kinase/response regulator